jgi:hypothetical protein
MRIQNIAVSSNRLLIGQASEFEIAGFSGHADRHARKSKRTHPLKATLMEVEPRASF